RTRLEQTVGAHVEVDCTDIRGEGVAVFEWPIGLSREDRRHLYRLFDWFDFVRLGGKRGLLMAPELTQPTIWLQLVCRDAGVDAGTREDCSGEETPSTWRAHGRHSLADPVPIVASTMIRRLAKDPAQGKLQKAATSL